ncbi:MAG: DUF2505 family protein [Actinomycetaceae bacterium]|nr:DUF2505 family protein [Actinomycetaceae bacterium]
MDITSNLSFDASPEQVVRALLSPELAAKRAALAKVDDYTHDVNGNTAVTTINVPAERLPSKARSFARNGAKATITSTASGTSVDYKVDLHGLPAEVSARVDLTGTDTTTGTLNANLNVKIPLVGGKIEKRAAGMVDRVLAKDAKLVSEVIAGQ